MSTISQILSMAVVRHDDRKVTYAWRTVDKTQKVDGDLDLWGEQISLSFSHDRNRKEYDAYLRHSHWQDGRGYIMERYALFSGENPAMRVRRESVARYSEKSFQAFVASTIAHLDANPNALTELAERYTRTHLSETRFPVSV